MRAIVVETFGGLDSLVYKEIPEPEPKAGHVVIQIKAFGINHAEMHMRRGEWAEAAEVSGIECVGLSAEHMHLADRSVKDVVNEPPGATRAVLGVTLANTTTADRCQYDARTGFRPDTVGRVLLTGLHRDVMRSKSDESVGPRPIWDACPGIECRGERTRGRWSGRAEITMSTPGRDAGQT